MGCYGWVSGIAAIRGHISCVCHLCSFLGRRCQDFIMFSRISVTRKVEVCCLPPSSPWWLQRAGSGTKGTAPGPAGAGGGGVLWAGGCLSSILDMRHEPACGFPGGDLHWPGRCMWGNLTSVLGCFHKWLAFRLRTRK